MANETEVGENPYFSKVVNYFKEYSQKKQQMEADFRPEIAQDYTALMKDYVEVAAELLKFGTPKRLEDNEVILIIDDEEFSVPRDKVKKELSDRQWETIFPETKTEKYTDTGNDSYREIKDNPNESAGGSTGSGYSGYGYYAPPAPQQIVNPLGSFLSAILSPFLGAYGGQQAPPPQSNAQNAPPQGTPQGTPPQNGQPFPQGIPRPEPPKPKETDILDDFSGIQRKIVKLEKERDTAQGERDAVKQKFEEYKKESEKQIEELTKAKESSDGAYATLTAEMNKTSDDYKTLTENYSKLKEFSSKQKADTERTKQEDGKRISELGTRINELNTKANRLNQELEASRKECNAIKTEKESLTTQLATAKTGTANLNEKIATLEKQLEEVKKNADERLKNELGRAKTDAESRQQEDNKKLTEYKDRADKDAKKIEALNGSLRTITNERDTLKAETNKLSKEKDALSKKNSEYAAKDAEKEDYYRKLEKETGELKKLAYSDQKTGTMNLNAFNRDFAKCDIQTTIIAMVGIRNMKIINNMHGRTAGNNVIGQVASLLTKYFNKESVYRIMGDQFVVIAKNGNTNNVLGQMSKIRGELNQNSIDIAYGVAAGAGETDLGIFLGKAEGLMNDMRNGSTLMGNTGYQEGYQPQMAPTNQPPMGQPPVNPMGQPAPQQVSPPQQAAPQEISVDELLSEYMSTQN